ncbi:MAG: AMP-binding protein [Thermomicrobiales bacterium]
MRLQERIGARQAAGTPGYRLHRQRSDPVVDEMNDVPRDAKTLGEVVMRGNIVMAGYYNDPDATNEAFRGWFHSGETEGPHPDRAYRAARPQEGRHHLGRGEHPRRSKSSRLLQVLECRRLDAAREMGERPKAFVICKDGQLTSDVAIIAHVRNSIAHFKAPDAVDFVTEPPKTATGKIQKFVLREAEWQATKRGIYGGTTRNI